ncbi:MAG: Gfo/Idh/MocA family oxidoreductase [Abditibacteriales bacterium]|nr:Gfo/Idh/MocA family oxidoreductase [Abditibacteriales bacterium]
MIHIAVVGCGYWGINYVRVFSELPDSKVVLACDTSEERLRAVRERFPLIPTTSDWEEAVNNKWVDAVVIATPATTHFAIAQQCLLLGKHVLVEKPLTTTVEDGEALVKTAQQQGRVLMVGHTFLYNPGIRKVKELMAREDFGKVYYLHATRTNMGPVRRDVNALWDLASHDVAIFNYLLDDCPQWVSAVGARVLNNGREDVGFATLHYADGVIANVHVSWVDPNKVREVVVVGSQRRVVFDDLNNVERVRIYEKGIAQSELEAGSFGEYRLLVRDGDIISPRVDTSEPLKNLGAHFLDCVAHGKPPLSDGGNGLDVVKVMTSIDQSLMQNGAPVKVVI